MHQTIICVPTPREIRVCPRDPKVERIVQEEIGEDRADYAPLRGSTQPLNHLAVNRPWSGATLSARQVATRRPQDGAWTHTLAPLARTRVFHDADKLLDWIRIGCGATGPWRDPPSPRSRPRGRARKAGSPTDRSGS